MQRTTGRFPRLERQIRNLVQQHRELGDEPLHLAMAYAPERDPKDIFLFELLGNFGGDEVNPDAELFEATFDSTESFPMGRGQKLHLVLTSPNELRSALAQHWPTAEEIRDAVQRGDFKVLHTDDLGRESLTLLVEQASSPARANTTRKSPLKTSPESLNERASSMAATGSKRQRKRRARP